MPRSFREHGLRTIRERYRLGSIREVQTEEQQRGTDWGTSEHCRLRSIREVQTVDHQSIADRGTSGRYGLKSNREV